MDSVTASVKLYTHLLPVENMTRGLNVFLYIFLLYCSIFYVIFRIRLSDIVYVVNVLKNRKMLAFMFFHIVNLHTAADCCN